jgi:hypothetical protein
MQIFQKKEREINSYENSKVTQMNATASSRINAIIYYAKIFGKTKNKKQNLSLRLSFKVGESVPWD